MAHRKQGYRFQNDWTEQQMHLLLQREGLKIATTIPVDIEIKMEHRVLNLHKARQYIEKASQVAVLNCVCKTLRRNCAAPLDVCITMDSAAEHVFSTSASAALHPRRIGKEEAMQILERSHEAGLVHMAYSFRDDKVNAICSCCSCCCWVLSSVLRFGLFPHLLTSDTKSLTDLPRCNNCGVCATRCQFGARKMAEGVLAFDPKLCMGCGLCVTKCPTEAIKLVAK